MENILGKLEGSQSAIRMQTNGRDNATSKETMRVAKDPSRSRLSGGMFEMQLAGLVNIRLRAQAHRLGSTSLHYLIATNMADANPFDDIVLRVKWIEGCRQRSITYFVQMKHAEKVTKPVTNHDLTGEISKRNKDFNLRKYFQFFQELRKFRETPAENLDGNQKLLSEWAQGEYRFVLFTTREVLPRQKHTRGTSSLDFPFEEVFSSQQGEVFCFGEQDVDIWNMFQDTQDENSFRAEFLPRLRIFSAQAQVTALQRLLTRALVEDLGVSLPRAAWMMEKYSAVLHDWWSSSEGTCFTEDSSEIEVIVREGLHAEFENLLFQTRYVEDLERRSRNIDAAYVVVPGIPVQLRCSRLWSLLERTTPDRFVVLSGGAFSQFSSQLLLSLCSKLCDALVLCVGPVNRETRTFLQTLLSSRTCKVWVVTSAWEPREYSWLLSLQRLCDAWSETWSLEQLEHEEQQRLLGCDVSFQGHQMALAELMEAWPSLGRSVRGASLGSIAVERQLVIGAPLKEADEHYLPRTLQHRTIMLPSVFQHASADDHFLLSGFPDDILKILRSSDSPWQECLLTGASWDDRSATQTKWSLWNSENDIKALKSEGKVNFHWLSYERQQIIWNGSTGDSNALQEHTEKKCGNCRSEPLCCHNDPKDLLKWNDTTLLLADIAGMGKSTFITVMAHTIKSHRRREWVILVKIKQKKLLDKVPETIGMDDVVDMLTESLASDMFEAKFSGLQCGAFGMVREEVLGTPTIKMMKRFLSECLNKTGKITMLLDGVDEVCPAQKVKTFRVLQLLQNALEASGGCLWVTSRSVLEEDLARVLRCASPLSLQSFSPEDQRKYLLRRWREDLADIEEDTLEAGVGTLVEALSEATGRRSICDVPLYTGMMAEVYTGRDLHRLFSNRTLNINRIDLYKKIVKKTLGSVWEKAGLTVENVAMFCVESDKSILEKHKMYAAWECFADDNLGKANEQLQKAVQELNDDFEREKAARTGIITDLVEGRPQFVHYTIREFLAALWLKDNYLSLPKLALALYERDFGEVRDFFDSLLAEGCPVHEAAISGRLDAIIESVQTFPQKIGARDSGGRTALHLSVIYGHEECVRYLLENGADVRAKDKVLNFTAMKYADVTLRVTPIPFLTIGKKKEKFLKVVEELIAGGSDLREAKRILKTKQNVLQMALENGYPRLAIALIRTNGPILFQKLLKREYIEIASMSKNATCVTTLARMGFKVNIKLTNGETCLHTFAKQGDEDTCVMLLRHGASVNARNSQGNSSLDLAAHCGHESLCLSFLKFGADVTRRNKHGATSLHHAATGGVESLCRHVLDCGGEVNAANKHGETALLLAARRGHEATCQLLLDRGADVDASDKCGHSVLHNAVFNGRVPLCRLLLDRGADVNGANKDGETPLHYAGYHKRAQVSRLLLGRGANVNATSSNGESVLHESVYSAAVCESVLRYGADVNATNRTGRTALHKAASGSLSSVCSLLLESGADVNLRDGMGQTPLYHAARNGRLENCRMLVEAGADVNALYDSVMLDDSISASMIAGVYGYTQTYEFLRALEMAGVQEPVNMEDSLAEKRKSMLVSSL